jgi:hypothetical protein
MYDVQKERQSSKEAISVHSDRRNSLIQIMFGQFVATKDRIKVGPWGPVPKWQWFVSQPSDPIHPSWT